MALVKAGALVQAIVGSLGDATYHVTAAGGYVKRRGAGPSRRSALSLNKKGQFQAAAAGWSNAFPLERIAWNVAAARVTVANKVGQQIRISGRALYMSVNVPLLQIGQPLQTYPPLSPTRAGFELAAGIVTPAGASMSFTTGAIPVGWCFIQGGRGFGLSAEKPRRYVQVNAFRYSTGSSVVGFSVEWERLLGYCSTGEKWFMRLRVLPDGQWWSPWQTLSGVTT